MSSRTEKWLVDIVNSILEIESFFEEGTQDFYAYQKDLMLKRAVERNLEIIGEAANRIRKENKEVADKISNLDKIVALRNLIIHAYDSVSDENIWSVLIKHIPILKLEIKKILEE